MNAQQTTAFRDLVRVWNRREDARSAGNIRDLSRASADLEHQRGVTRTMLGLR